MMLHRWRLFSLFTVAMLLLGMLPLSAGVAQATPGIAQPFKEYYDKHQGMRVLGYPVGDLTQAQGYPAQYFEKGRIEDHRGEVSNPAWEFMYGRLTAELMERDPSGSVSTTDVNFADLRALNRPENRQPAPAGFRGGTAALPSGGAFVPYDAALKPAPGYVVESQFWSYINRKDLFPGGWLHDIGLPVTGKVTTTVVKNGETREITLQAFERTVLSFDPKNPAGWQVERANIGADAIRTLPPLPTGLSPEEVITTFYDWYIHYPGNPLVTGAYMSSPYLSAEFKVKVEGIVASVTQGGYDPIICAQDVPESFKVDAATITGDKAAVVVHTSFAGHQFTVQLRTVKGEWVIADVECAPGSRSAIQLPAAGATVILPVHILARLGQPGEQATATLTWQDGTKLTNRYTLLRGEDGKGLLIGNLDWVNMLAPPEPKTQTATLHVLDAAGKQVASRTVTVVSPNAANTTEIKLYWTISGGPEIVQPQTRRVIKTDRIAATALEELLWGPPAISQVGFRTSIPTPEQVLAYTGREAGWGPRVRLLGVNIENGVATADFSKEMAAYGGGSLRVKMIRDQITMTLKQFPSVRDVVIAVEGQTEEVLQP